MPSRTPFALASILLLGATWPALAADLGGALPLPPPDDRPLAAPAPIWSGLYAGINGGYAWSRDSTRENSTLPYNGADFERMRQHSSSFTGGGQIGYNVQFGHLVAGIEADLNYLDRTRSIMSASGAVAASTSGSYVGTLRPRLGLAWGPWLLYGTAGLAFSDAQATITGNTANTLTASESGMRYGWAAGAGLEFAMDRNWSIRAEYLHVDLGRSTLTGSGLDANSYSWLNHQTDNMVRLGINYRF